MAAIRLPSIANEPLPCGVLLLGLAPVIMILLPWDFGPDSTEYRHYLRWNSLPGTIVELLFVGIAIARGFAPAAAIMALPRLAKAGLLLLAIGATWTTLFVAVMPMIAFLGIIKFFIHLLFALAMVQQLAGWTTGQRNQIWPAIGVGVVGYCLLWGINTAVYHPTGNDWIRLVPTLTNFRWVGFYALAGFCAGIGLLAANGGGRTGRQKLALAIFLSTTGLVIAFWTGTRAAVLATIVAVFVSSFVLPVRRQLWVLTLASAAVALVVASAIPLPHPWYGIERMIGASTPVDSVTEISSGRIEIWLDMLPKIADRPLLGWGIDQFRYSFPAGTEAIRHPHNGVLQWVVATGLLGVVAMTLFAVAFNRNIPRRFTESYQFAAMAFLIGGCAYGLYDGFFYYSYPVMILLVAAACVIAPPPSIPVTDRSG